MLKAKGLDMMGLPDSTEMVLPVRLIPPHLEGCTLSLDTDNFKIRVVYPDGREDFIIDPLACLDQLPAVNED